MAPHKTYLIYKTSPTVPLEQSMAYNALTLLLVPASGLYQAVIHANQISKKRFRSRCKSQAAIRKILGFVLGHCSTQDLVAVRIPAEALDDVSVLGLEYEELLGEGLGCFWIVEVFRSWGSIW